MATYTMNYDEISRQHGQLTQQLDELNRVLDDMVGIQENMLSAAQWSTEDKDEFTNRFNAFIQGGRQLYTTGMSEAETLRKVGETYLQAEQR